MKSTNIIRDNELDSKFDASVLPEDLLNGLWLIADENGETELKRKLEEEEFRRLEIESERWRDKQAKLN